MSDFDPTLPGHPDPYPIYQRLRDEDPVHWNSVMNGWVLSRYDDVKSFLKDPRFGRGAYLQSLREQFGESPAIKMLASDLGFVDPPGHTRLRALVNKAFTPRSVDSMRPRIQAAVDHLLDNVQVAGDPGHFNNPDRFDIRCEDNDHLAFSFGTRFCLGAPLARAEAQIAIGTIVRRMPNLKLATNRLEWQKADRFRSLKALPVVF